MNIQGRQTTFVDSEEQIAAKRAFVGLLFVSGELPTEAGMQDQPEPAECNTAMEPGESRYSHFSVAFHESSVVGLKFTLCDIGIVLEATVS
ncbi:MAG TPA: hypothetical protein VK846_05385 [Candidatus Limnocylindria bacterium]|nr:hypothetical protein [Candidatus Limnocylindria bacterium]